jgi:hypothetical protein
MAHQKCQGTIQLFFANNYYEECRYVRPKEICLTTESTKWLKKEYQSKFTESI